MPGQKSGARIKSAPPTKSARELWLNAVKSRTGTLNSGTRKQGTPGKRSPTEYWMDTLRKSGHGIGTEGTGVDTMTGLKNPADSQLAYLSTPHYLRQLAGTDKPKRGHSADPTGRSAPGTPAYKSPEEYYDDILGLKKQVTALNSDNSTLKARLRRVEDSNLKKEKEIEQLLDPSRSEEMRRTLADKKPDAGATVHSLKQKILKLEQQSREKESALTKFQSDMKVTKVEEMKVQLEAFYKEIVRLQNVKAGELARAQTPKASVPQGGAKENPAKIKALNDTIKRMNEKNVRLTQENQSLMKDLEIFLEDQAKQKSTQEEYEDMNKKQLLMAVTRLEKKLEKTEVDNLSVTSEIEKRRSDLEGKVKLEGNMAQKLDQLDKRETELLEELLKLRNSNTKMKEDRQHYRQKCDQKDKEIKSLTKEVEILQAELQSFYDKDKQKISPRRPSRITRRDSRESVLSHASAKSEARRETEREHRELERERLRKIEEFSKNRAAKSIQKGWKDRQRKREIEEDEAAEVIQSALRGHSARQKQLQRRRTPTPREEIDEDTEDDAVATIQSAYRGHKTRKDQMRMRSRSRTPEIATESDDEEAVSTIQSAFRGHQARKHNRVRSSSPMLNDPDYDIAVSNIQSAVRGHWARKKNVRTSISTPDCEENDEGVEMIQAAVRSHWTRTNYKPSFESPSSSRRSSLARHPSGRLDSAGEEEEESADEIMSSSRRSSVARRSPVSHRGSVARESTKRSTPSPRPPSRSKVTAKDEETDDDDDICF